MANSADRILQSTSRSPCVVGVLCIDIAKSLYEHYESQKPASYIAASYVKFLEAAGGSCVPIWIGRDREYYESMMDQINGMLLPGGAVYLNSEDNRTSEYPYQTNDCVKSVEYIYELALQRNKENRYFPIWVTCLGFQLMMISAAPSIQRTECGRTIFDALPLQLTEDYANSTMFRDLSPELREHLHSEPFACYHHKYCITVESLGDMASDWRVLATGKTVSDVSFITLIEHKKYPFYGCQFHPERAAYEQLFARADPLINAHTKRGIQLNQHFAHFFVNACRRNENTMEQLERHLIHNWKPEFCGMHKDVNWLQVYLFPKDVDYVKEEKSS